MNIEQEIEVALESILEEGMLLKHISVDVDDSVVTVIIEAPGCDDQTQKALSRNVAKLVKIDYGFKGVKLSIDVPTVKKETLESSIKYITITSGKGGVGKSTVAANLAVALARIGKKVGIIDADVYGPSLPKVFGITEPKMSMNEQQKIIPMKTVDGVTIISTEFLTPDDQPLMWRGPMLSRMIEYFFDDVIWEADMDYIIIDLPPGTGDVPLDLNNFVPKAKAIVVTTPNKMASEIAIKSGQMAQNLGHDLLGIVENMSYFTNPVNGAAEKIFGNGGGEIVAQALVSEVIAQIPIAPVKEESSNGIFAIHEENGIAYLGLANKVMKSYA
jgi:ATP-binding protein involved in chromosome partitioning